MIDIEQVRNEPDLFRRAVASKKVPLDIDELLQIDQQRRDIEREVNALRAQRNRISELIARSAQGREQQIADSRTLADQLAAKEREMHTVRARFQNLMGLVPGVPCNTVPTGDTEADNVEIRRVGTPPQKGFKLRDHLELTALHAMVEFAGPRTIAGSRAYALVGNGALLELAVMRFALDFLLNKRFIPVLPPLMVKAPAMFGTGYFPLGEDNAYQLEKDGLFLTGTSEVGLVAMHINQTLKIEELPKRYAGFSPCFRREAGAAGRDTKGLYRVHQFQKVEQIVFCRNDVDVSAEEHFMLLENSEQIVQALELPYRVVALCTAELGLGQVRKHDIETWMPSRGQFCETHSCSSFHDFQARRLGIKYTDGKGKWLVHTLNNTAIASPRILIALLENHQTADGCIYIPAAIRPYMNGIELLEPP